MSYILHSELYVVQASFTAHVIEAQITFQLSACSVLIIHEHLILPTVWRRHPRLPISASQCNLFPAHCLIPGTVDVCVFCTLHLHTVRSSVYGFHIPLSLVKLFCTCIHFHMTVTIWLVAWFQLYLYIQFHQIFLFIHNHKALSNVKLQKMFLV